MLPADKVLDAMYDIHNINKISLKVEFDIYIYLRGDPSAKE
jgi:hypothetical protein